MRRNVVALIVVVALFCSPACRNELEDDPRARFPVTVEGVTYDPPLAELPRLTFRDGARTANDRCMILERKLNTKIPPIYVNGAPLGFC